MADDQIINQTVEYRNIFNLFYEYPDSLEYDYNNDAVPEYIPEKKRNLVKNKSNFFLLDLDLDLCLRKLAI